MFLSLSKASWPDGKYCLPMPSSKQCPSGWKAGYRFHDSNDESPSSRCFTTKDMDMFRMFINSVKILAGGFAARPAAVTLLKHFGLADSTAYFDMEVAAL